MTTAKPAPPGPGADWLTTAQAGEIAQASQWVIEKWIRDGLLPARRWRVREYLIRPADLDEFLASRSVADGTLAEQIRRVLAEGGDFPEPTDDQIRLIAMLLPRRKAKGDVA